MTPAASTTSPFQGEIVLDPRRFVVGIAGRGSGKTTAFVWKLITLMQQGAIPTGARILVFGPNYPQLRMGTLKTFDKWFDQTGFVVKKIDGNEPERRLVRDITVYFRNASNPEQTRSHEVCIVWLDEAGQMTEDVLRLSNAALRQFGDEYPYQTWISSTPRGRNWLYRYFKDPLTRRYSDDLLGYYETSTIEAQKYGVVRAGYVEEMGYVPGTEMYNQEILAQYVTWGGLVFDQNWLTPEPFILPPFSRIDAGIDFGQISPSVIKVIGRDQRGAFWDFREFYQPRCDFSLLLKTAAEYQNELGIRAFWCDNANPELIATLRAGGVRAYACKKKPEIATSFINGMIHAGRYYLAPDCHFTRMELEAYQYKEQLRGDETAFTDKVKPDQADHAINANQYCILPLSGKTAQSGWGEMSFG